MVASISPVQVKRCKFTNKMVWSSPDLHMRVVSDSYVARLRMSSISPLKEMYVPAIGRELDRFDGFVEIEVVENYTPTEVN